MYRTFIGRDIDLILYPGVVLAKNLGGGAFPKTF